MAVTLANLRAGVLRKLDEQNTSKLGALLSGDGGADLKTTAQTITDYLNAAQDKLSETSVLLRATSASLAVTANTRIIAISAFVVTQASRTLRVVRDLLWTPTSGTQVQLKRANFWAVQAQYPGHLTQASGTIANWYFPDEDERRVGIIPPPSGTGALIANGYGYPPLLVSDSDTVSWIPDDWTEALEYYAAGMLCRKGMSDPEMAAKEELMFSEWNRLRLVMLSEQDEYLAKAYLRRDPSLEPVEERRKVVNGTAGR